MKCPECGLVNPKTAQRCKCGYAFAAGNAARLQMPFPPRRVAWWKRFLLRCVFVALQYWMAVAVVFAILAAGLHVSIGVSVVLVVLAIVAVAARRAFANRLSPPRTWPKVDLKGLGIRLRLKTEWQDGGVAYQFNVEPRPADLAATLDEAWHSTLDIDFTILLADRSGFQMCELNLGRDDLARNLDDLGRVVSLSANRDFACSRAKYINSQSWTVRYASPTPPVDVPLWKQKSQWRLLRKGMTPVEVRALLGDPGKVRNDITGEYWYYPDVAGGEVDFDGDSGVVSGWEEPGCLEREPREVAAGEPREVAAGEPKRRPRGFWEFLIEIGLDDHFTTTLRKPMDAVRLPGGSHIFLLERHEDSLVEGFREPMEKWTAYSLQCDRVQTYFLPRETRVRYAGWAMKPLLKRWVRRRVARVSTLSAP